MNPYRIWRSIKQRRLYYGRSEIFFQIYHLNSFRLEIKKKKKEKKKKILIFLCHWQDIFGPMKESFMTAL